MRTLGIENFWDIFFQIFKITTSFTPKAKCESFEVIFGIFEHFGKNWYAEIVENLKLNKNEELIKMSHT